MDPMADASQQPVDPWRVYAESFVLQVIGELTGERERRLREVDGATLCRGDHWRDVFETEFSVTHSLIAGIREQWQRRRDLDPAASPDEFAREVALEAFRGTIDLER
jgi:hypothetical protein